MIMTTEQIEGVYDAAESIMRIENVLRIKLLKQENQIAVALAYLKADQPHLAKLVLEGMEP